MKNNNNSLTKDEILAFLSLLDVQATYPKAYKRIATNSFELLFAHDCFKV
jgi:hypothetical protein